MVYVAFNDGLTFVMARSMKSLHFSVMMFWFSAIGMVALVSFITLKALYLQTTPLILTYNYDQM